MEERREDTIKTEKSALYHAGIAGEASDIIKGRAEGKVIGVEKMIAGMRTAGLTEEQIEAILKTER